MKASISSVLHKDYITLKLNHFLPTGSSKKTMPCFDSMKKNTLKKM